MASQSAILHPHLPFGYVSGWACRLTDEILFLISLILPTLALFCVRTCMQPPEDCSSMDRFTDNNDISAIQPRPLFAVAKVSHSRLQIPGIDSIPGISKRACSYNSRHSPFVRAATFPLPFLRHVAVNGN